MVCILALPYTVVQAQDSNSSSKTITSFESSKASNPFVRAIKYHNSLEEIKLDLKKLKKSLKKNIRLGNIKLVREIEDQIDIQSSKQKILSEKSQDIYNKITSITTKGEPFNLLNFFSEKPLRDAQKAINRLNRLREQYHKVVNLIKEDINKLRYKIKKTSPEDKKIQYKLELGEKLQDQRYILGFNDLIDKQYDHLLDQRSNIESQYYEYRDSEIMKHVSSIIILLILFILTFFIRRLALRFVQEDERQFVLRRSISTVAIIIGIIFITFTYSENIIYSLTVFTFVGTAIIIATRTFLLNLVAWLHILLSKFIQVGDRIIIPHETKYYHGDVINISPVQITLYETYDFSSTRQAVNAGRIVFIPNNYIFSHGVINYTHQGQKYFYDFLSFNLAFDSDLSLTEKITKEVVSDYTKKYLEDAKAQFNTLKKRYAVKQRIQEPEIQFNVNSGSTGITMTAWYLAPNNESTTLKNSLLKTLLERFNEQESIMITKKIKSEKEGDGASSES